VAVIPHDLYFFDGRAIGVSALNPHLPRPYPAPSSPVAG